MSFSRIVSLSASSLLSRAARPSVLTSSAVRHFKKKPTRIAAWPNDWLPFEWDYPPRQMGYFDTGDPEEKVEQVVDLKKIYKPGFEFLSERDDLPEFVKKLFLLDNSYRLEITNYIRANRNRRYQRHPFDLESHEVMIANYTSKIRQLKEVVLAQPNNAYCKVLINHYKLKRHKFLNQLSRMDAKRFESLIKDLKINFTPDVPGTFSHERVERKRSLRRLTDAYCHNIKKAKLEAFAAKLKEQQEPFRKEAEETQKWIEDEMTKWSISDEDLKTGFKPRPKYRDPHPVRPLVSELQQ